MMCRETGFRLTWARRKSRKRSRSDVLSQRGISGKTSILMNGRRVFRVQNQLMTLRRPSLSNAKCSAPRNIGSHIFANPVGGVGLSQKKCGGPSTQGLHFKGGLTKNLL